MLPEYPTEFGNFRFEDANLGEIISYLLPYIFGIAGLALLVFLVLGGFKLLTSGGDPKNIEAGKKIVTNAVIGFIILISSYWLYQIIQTTLLNKNVAPNNTTPQISCSERCIENGYLTGYCAAGSDCLNDTDVNYQIAGCRYTEVCCCQN